MRVLGGWNQDVVPAFAKSALHSFSRFRHLEFYLLLVVAGEFETFLILVNAGPGKKSGRGFAQTNQLPFVGSEENQAVAMRSRAVGCLSEDLFGFEKAFGMLRRLRGDCSWWHSIAHVSQA